MEIIVGKTAGFCYGVKRAVEGSQALVNEKEQIYCLGELVHNKQVVTELQEKGIKFVEDINDVPNGSKLIIRAHGVPKEVYEIAKNKNIELVDYTCPNVLKIHEIAKKYHNDGYYIILTGKATHPEVIGIKSYAGDMISIIESPEEVEKALNEFEEKNINKLLLISQTTFNTQKFEIIKDCIEQKIQNNIELIINNTICAATEIRQKEIEKMSLEVDKMIIIGGKNSSNTKKLYEIASKNCKDTILIETKDELDGINFNSINKVGIMAGASTPQNAIDDVIEYLNQLQ